VQALIKEADKNGDGMIDYQEFHEVLRENTRGSKPSAAVPALAKA
jgi:EF hand